MQKECLNNVSEGYEDFPLMQCLYSTRKKMDSSNKKIRYKALREASSAFIKRKDVRKYIFKKKGENCYICGNIADQIDHRISVVAFARDMNSEIGKLNAFDNLFPICRSCNCSKLPDI